MKLKFTSTKKVIWTDKEGPSYNYILPLMFESNDFARSINHSHTTAVYKTRQIISLYIRQWPSVKTENIMWRV